ncbi:MAG: hypothetical protein Q8K86_05860 [Candidatus Nanopelagicaceae bacterium]|nr:hypothetical protein [Candidatus Nanopelagicaceae bacterium]
MKVGIDIDGTISDAPWLFQALTEGLKTFGHEIHIITFRGDRQSAVADLQHWKIKYDKLHTTSKDVPIGVWKREIVQDYGINFMIDDMPEVLRTMPPGVGRLWLCSPEIYKI